MHKCSRNQDTCPEVLGTEQEGGWDAKARELDDEDGKCTGRRRHK